jgi:hypothetical protein
VFNIPQFLCSESVSEIQTKALVINRRRFRRLSELVAWERKRVVAREAAKRTRSAR